MVEYLKMAYWFSGMTESQIADYVYDGGIGYGESEAAAHAINSHDGLVAEVERLRGIIDAIADCEIDDAPHGYSHEESSAWSSGYNYLAMKIRDAI